MLTQSGGGEECIHPCMPSGYQQIPILITICQLAYTVWECCHSFHLLVMAGQDQRQGHARLQATDTLWLPLIVGLIPKSVMLAGESMPTTAVAFSWPGQFSIAAVITMCLLVCHFQFSVFKKFISWDQEKRVSSLVRLVNIPNSNFV